MKKLNLAIAVIMIIFFSSCKKHFTCECNTEGEIVGTPYSDSYSDSTPKLSKKNAKAWCEEESDSFADGYNTNYTVTCNLK